MELSHPEARALKRLLRQMTREGHIVMTRKGLYGLLKTWNSSRGILRPIETATGS